MATLDQTGAQFQAPPKMTITNLSSGETLEAQYNPTELNEKLTAIFGELDVQGHSSKPMQWKNTDNLELTFDLSFDDLNEPGKLDYARRFLHSLYYPVRGGSTVLESGPPSVLLVWPQVVSVVGRFTSLSGKMERFAVSDLRATLYKASLTLRECLARRIFMDEVLANGTLRDGG